ncbi:MAG: beta-lactamase family protein [Saprospiraceae bacterium]|nr:beta-lactamase family protein [Saprospiraceae bacterium]
MHHDPYNANPQKVQPRRIVKTVSGQLSTTHKDRKYIKLKQIFFILHLFISASICNGQTIGNKIDSIVHKYDNLGGYNGIIIVGFGADSLLTFEYGYKDPTTKKDRISLNDRFDLASVAKQFTGLAILQLIEKGVIHQEDSIGKYFPKLKPALQKVTIKQLANHTNGIHDFYSLTTRHDTVNKQEAITMLSKLDTTVFAPGSRWGYSNSGYLLLSEIVEQVTKMSFQDYCHKNVLVPLGMTQACYLPECSMKLYGYDDSLNPVIFNAFSSGEAGMYVSGKDLIAYYQTVCRNPEHWAKYFVQSHEFSEASNTENWNYGFGWFFTEDRLGKFRAHSGRNWGAHTYIRWYDDTNIFLCLLSNKKTDNFLKS